MHQEYKYSSLSKDNFEFDRVYEDLQNCITEEYLKQICPE